MIARVVKVSKSRFGLALPYYAPCLVVSIRVGSQIYTVKIRPLPSLVYRRTTYYVAVDKESWHILRYIATKLYRPRGVYIDVVEAHRCV